MAPWPSDRSLDGGIDEIPIPGSGRLWLAGKWLLGRLVGRRRPPLAGADRLAAWMVDHYAEVLSTAELESFFGGDEAVFPFDPQGHDSAP